MALSGMRPWQRSSGQTCQLVLAGPRDVARGSGCGQSGPCSVKPQPHRAKRRRHERTRSDRAVSAVALAGAGRGRTEAEHGARGTRLSDLHQCTEEWRGSGVAERLVPAWRVRAYYRRGAWQAYMVA
jgi:hypothetical protein